MAGRADHAGACQGSEQFPQRDELDAFHKENSIPGIAGIDTRALTKIPRGSGTMNGMITTEEYPDLEEAVSRIKEYRVSGVVARVSCKEMYTMAAEDFMPTDYEEARMTYMAGRSMRAANENAKRAGISLGEIAMCSVQGNARIAKLNAAAACPGKAGKRYRVAMMDFGTRQEFIKKEPLISSPLPCRQASPAGKSFCLV